MTRIHWLLSAIALLVALGVGLYALDLSRQAMDRRRIAEQQREAARQQQYEELKDRRSSLTLHVGSNERAIKTFCHADQRKKTMSADVAFDKKECEILQATHRQLVQEMAKNEEEMKNWLAASQRTR